MAHEKITIEMFFDPTDPYNIGFDFDGLNGSSGSDSVDDFIEHTLPEALRDYIRDAIRFRGEKEEEESSGDAHCYNGYGMGRSYY